VTRRLNHADDLLPASPAWPADHLQMEDLYRQACLFPNPQRLLDCSDFTLAFTSYVSRVNASVLPGNFREFDQFLRLGLVAGRVDERSRNAERTLLHRFGDESLHIFDLVRTMRAICVTHDVLPYQSCASLTDDVAD